eukprot:GHVT01070272.1.p1 GENE.GHVT01070272.1~~GHVT01070272.1.p1  ORF type:complete len:146 (+),score=20.41 GHVT01070272.1:987-1424(+)
MSTFASNDAAHTGQSLRCHAYGLGISYPSILANVSGCLDTNGDESFPGKLTILAAASSARSCRFHWSSVGSLASTAASVALGAVHASLSTAWCAFSVSWSLDDDRRGSHRAKPNSSNASVDCGKEDFETRARHAAAYVSPCSAAN